MNKYVAICHVIASVLSADGIMQESERALLEEAMEDMDLSPEDRALVRDFKNEGAEEVVAAMPLEDKQRLRDGLLAATLADGKISPQEQEVVKRVTELMKL